MSRIESLSMPSPKACPFCASTRLRITSADHPRACVSVDCLDCHAQGPYFEAQQTFSRKPKTWKGLFAWNREADRVTELAIKAWNKRIIVVE